MPDSHDPLVVVILAVPESTASTLYGMYEILESTGRDWGLVTSGTPGRQCIRPIIASADGKGFRTPNGLSVEPGCTLADCPAPHVVAIPDLMIMPGDNLAGRFAVESQWLRDRYTAGATLATACTGALILAEAGLLDGQDATTHWAYCESMSSTYPSVRLHPNRSLVVSGEGRLIMAGGGSSWHDMTLFLIARFVGTEEAMRVARLQLLDWHHVGQQPFAALMRSRQVSDAVVARCQEWIAQNYQKDSPVTAMAVLSGLAERSFKRRFAQAVGMPPLEYVHALRLEESKRLLEVSGLPLDEIACRVGYEDATFLGRLFRRKVGVTPAQYRKRFRALRHALDGSVETRITPAVKR
jgi:transcriptional regulator GlxA family with amidase domain